jgi:hypothetical protein
LPAIEPDSEIRTSMISFDLLARTSAARKKIVSRSDTGVAAQAL